MRTHDLDLYFRTELHSDDPPTDDLAPYLALHESNTRSGADDTDYESTAPYVGMLPHESDEVSPLRFKED